MRGRLRGNPEPAGLDNGWGAVKKDAVGGVLRGGDDRRLGMLRGRENQKRAARGDEREGGYLARCAGRGGNVRLCGGRSLELIGAFVLGEELGGGDVREVAAGVIERGLECGTPDEDERADHQAESTGEQAQTGP